MARIDTHHLQLPNTIINVLQANAEERPHALAYRYIEKPREGHGSSITYLALDLKARRIAAYLARRVVADDRVLLFFPPGLDYIAAFLGCLYAGVVAVPLYPPRRGEKLTRIVRVVQDCGARCALGLEQDIARMIESTVRELPTLLSTGFELIAIDSASECEPIPQLAYTRRPEDLAFLQYTSGSTGEPKGVMVSHGNLMANQAVIADGFQSCSSDVCLNWLPLYHDMGLIGTTLHPLYCGYPSHVMSPVAFIQDPLSWLEGITRERATVAGGPDFAYALCAKAAQADPQRAATLDLCSWRLAFNGAEPIRARTLSLFSKAFSAVGFNRSAVFPCYGLAEATLFVTGACPGEGASLRRFERLALSEGRLSDGAQETTTELVSCGRAPSGHDIRIVKDGHVVPDGTVGEIWVAGPSVTAGYWGRKQDNDEVFRARLSQEPDTSLRFLRTGDLGCLHGGELFVTGRLKDVLILNGRNYYPQDIEVAASTAHQALRPGCTAAFSVDSSDGIKVVVVQEVDPRQARSIDAAAVVAAIRSGVAASTEVTVDDVVLIQAASIPKTSSGKIRRAETRKRYLSETLDTIDATVRGIAQPAAPVSPAEKAFFDRELLHSLPETGIAPYFEGVLRNLIAAKTGQRPDAVPPDAAMTGLGMNSLAIVQLHNMMQKELGVAVAIEALFKGQSLRELASALAQELAARTTQPSTPAPELPTVLPLSKNQEQMWFLHQVDPARHDYNVPLLIECRPGLDEAALRASLAAAASRHTVLRTRYAAGDSGSTQTVVEPGTAGAEPDFTVVDVCGLDDTGLRHLMQQEAALPFDLEHGSVFRVRLAQLDGCSWLLLCLHHIATDFWSLAALAEEILVGCTGANIPVPEKDYREWCLAKQAYLGSEAAVRDRTHWQHRLGKAPAASNLHELNGAGDQVAAPGRLNLTMPATWVEPARRMAEQEGRTLNAVCLAAFQWLLHKQSGQARLCIGTVAADRGDWRYERTQGYFANPIALSTSLEPNDDFRSFLRRSANELAEALAHQAYPFALVVQEFSPTRRANQQPLFQALFLMQQSQRDTRMAAFSIKGARAETRIGELDVRALPLESAPPSFELVLTLAESHDGGVEAMLEYGGQVVGSKLAKSILDGWVREMRSLEVAITQTMVPSIAEPQSGLSDCRSLLEGFERQVRRSPDRVAVCCGSVSLSYRALDERATALSLALCARGGAGGDAPVAVLLDRGIDTVVSIIAALKAGASYLPLDPHSPRERLAVILADAAPRVLITSSAFDALLAEVEESRSLDVLRIDAPLGDVRRCTPPPAARAGRDDRAYVIFTSGSTGRPKGVQVSHGNVLRLFTCCEDRFGFTEDDVWALFHSFAFDFSVWEMWGALLYGGRLVVVPYEVTRSATEFRTLLRQEGVTVLNQTPSAFGHLVGIDAALPERLDALRLVIFGGEALVFSRLTTWFDKYGDTHPRLVNMYGITETTVHVTWRPVTRADVDCSSSLIGSPLPDLSICLLDKHFHPVADGEVGEIFVGGAGVSIGYLGQPSLTTERFIELEVHPRSRQRYYRSGDLARRTPEGDLEFHGRADLQISINGFRIEPREVESAIGRFPGIRGAVVVAKADTAEDTAGVVAEIPRGSTDLSEIRQLLRSRPHRVGRSDAQVRLVAYVVSDEPPELQALHRHLSGYLPDYMIPTIVYPVSAIPLNHNGKVDLLALQVVAKKAWPLRASYVAPRNAAERRLVELFAEVLDKPRVGIHDGFFELGGDSIRIIQLRSKALKSGLNISVQDIFKLQTPAALAAVTEGAAPLGERPRLPPFAQIAESERSRLPADAVDAYPLARLQEGLLFHSLYGEDVAMYCDIFEFRLAAPYDESAFRAAAQALVDRHPIFRTSFHFADFDRPLQVVNAQVNAQIDAFDHRSAPRAEQDARYQAWLDAEKRNPYDVSRAPLLRFSLHRMADEEFIFTMSFHDALLDGWSESSTVTELLGNYFRLLGHHVAEPASTVQTSFSDFVALEQESLADASVRGFWENELEDMQPTRLPTWNCVPPNAPSKIVFHAATLSEAVSKEIHALAQRLGVSVKHVLLAAHAAVVGYVCGESDVVLAVESNGRLEDGDGEQVLGTHLNVVPWRLSLGDQNWEQLIRQLHAKENSLQPYRRYPYQAIQNLKGNEPLFDISFNYTHFHVYEDLARLPGLRVLDAKAYIHTHFGLRVEFNQDPFTHDLTLDLEANVEVVPTERLQAIGRYFTRVLEAIANAPSEPMASACMLDLDELSAELVAAAGLVTATSGNEPTLYLQQFEQAVRDHADSIAAVDRHRSVRYLELARESRRAAAALRRHGVSKGNVVGLMCERSIDMLVAMLATWRLGAAFVPLPDGPAERVERILDLAGATHLLHAHSHEAPERALTSKAHRVPLEALTSMAVEPEVFDDATLQSDDLAYMIFTSGSTGEPKGVMIEHGGMINHMEAKIEDLSIGTLDKVSQDAAATFDICVWQFCAPLLSGAQVRVFEDDIAKDPSRLLDRVVEERISVLEVSPSVLSTMLVVYAAQAGRTRGLLADSALRWIVSSGETLQPSLVHQLREAHPQVGILNMWGATETSDDCTHYVVPLNLPDQVETISIGRPIRNSAVYVLDAWRRLVPVGTPGELYVAGLCVGRGYANDTERTAGAFLSAPWTFATSDRLYRSGDRGWRAADGQLYFIGRRDHQVKIRGHRIEIGEVEAVLNRQVEVQEAVVRAVPDADGQLALAAWVVPADAKVLESDTPQGTWIATLRRQLKQSLPAYMVPDTFMLQPELPRNTSGKVDRKALVMPETSLVLHDDASVVAPRDDVEATVLALFLQVLKRPQLSIDIGFFDAGGNSLLATQLVSRARRQFDIDLPIRALFENATVAAFSLAVRAAGASEANVTIPRADPRPTHIPLSFNQERLWFLDRFEGADRAYGSHFALRIGGHLDILALSCALQSIVDRHEILRTRFVAEDSEQPWQIVEPHMTLPFQQLDLRSVPEAQRQSALSRAIDAEVTRPFHLDALPLCGATLVRMADDEHVLLWRNHHIIGDGWSAGVIMREFECLFRALISGSPAALPTLPIQFADYAIWQRQQIGTDRFDRLSAFWKRYLEDHAGALDLPTDFERPSRLTFEGRRIAVTLPQSLTSQVRNICADTGVTIYGFLQCALGLLMSRYCKQNDLLMGTAVANRQHVETEPLIGFLTNTLPVRHRFNPTLSFSSHLKRLHGELLEVFDHQDMPFEHLVKTLVRGRDSNINPLVQVMFVLQNEDLTPPRVDGLCVEALEVDRSASILDLVFDLRETAQGIAGEVEFNSRLFQESTVRALWHHFQHLVEEIVAAPNEPLANVSAVSKQEQRALDALWQSLQPKHAKVSFRDERAAQAPQWEEYLQRAEKGGVLLSAYMAISEYE